VARKKSNGGISPKREQDDEAENDKNRIDNIIGELGKTGKQGGQWAPPQVTSRKKPKGNETTGWRSF
jgi:hypothetical protein